MKFENAFRSLIDLKSHRAKEHSKNLSKQQVKQERTINIDINLPPRTKPGRGRGMSGDKNISILHLSCRMSELQFSLILQTHALVLQKRMG